MAARIFQISKAVNQSGQGRSGKWVLEFESHARKRPDPLTGWSGGADTQAQVSINFDSLEAATAYAEREGIAYHVIPATTRKLRIQSYADNFK
nr:ETC complex I subunit [uncultured Sphingosinicella sp.]